VLPGSPQLYSGRNPVGPETAALWQGHIRTPGHVAEIPWASRPTYGGGRNSAAATYSTAPNPEIYSSRSYVQGSDYIYNRDTRRRFTGTLTDTPALLGTPDQGGLAAPAPVGAVAPAGIVAGSSVQQNHALQWNPVNGVPRHGSWCSTKGSSYRETRFPASTAIVHEHSCSGASRTVIETTWNGRNDSCGVLYSTYRVNQRWSDAVTSGYPTHEKLLCGSEPEIAHNAPSSCNPTAYNVTNIVKTNLEDDHHFSGTSEQLLDASVWDVSETRRSTFTCSASIAPASMAEMTRVDITGNLEPNI